MYRKWTKNDIEASKARFRRLYAQSPIEYRFLCGHDIQSEDDEDALDYYMIGVWLVQHRKYSDWSKEYNGPPVQTKFKKIIMNQIIPYQSILLPEPTNHVFAAAAVLRSRVALTG